MHIGTHGVMALKQRQIKIYWGEAHHVHVMLKFINCGGVVVERRTPNREVLGSIPTGVTVVCP